LDCVASWISTTKDSRDDRAEKVLEWYIAYHETITSKQVMVLKFDDLIADPLGSINKVCERYGINKSFFSTNKTLSDAMKTEIDFVWANRDKSDYSIIKQEICLNGLYPDAVELFEVLCVPVG
jgi:hypothetical protein